MYRCGRKSEGGRVGCLECRSKRNRQNRVKYWQCVDAGLCADCEQQPALVGHVRCADCHEYNNLHSAVTYARARFTAQVLREERDEYGY